MKRNIILIFFLYAFYECKSLKEGKEAIEICYDHSFSQPVQKASLKNVEAIKKINGKFIEIEGIFHYNFEDIALYPTKESHSTEAIWINLKIPDTISDSLLAKLNGRGVTIIGKVNVLDRGHYNGYFSALDSAFCIKEE